MFWQRARAALIAGVDGGRIKRRSAAAQYDLIPIGKPVPDVCFAAHYGLKSDIASCPKSANNKHRRCGPRALGPHGEVSLQITGEIMKLEFWLLLLTRHFSSSELRLRNFDS
jgi:hypothetical protein